MLKGRTERLRLNTHYARPPIFLCLTADRPFWIFLTRWSTRPDRTLSDRALCLLRRSLFAPTARAFLATWCFLLGLRATAGICASAAPPFSVTIRSVSLLAIATLWVIPRHMPTCVAHQTRAGCDDKAKNAFQ